MWYSPQFHSPDYSLLHFLTLKPRVNGVIYSHFNSKVNRKVKYFFYPLSMKKWDMKSRVIWGMHTFLYSSKPCHACVKVTKLAAVLMFLCGSSNLTTENILEGVGSYCFHGPQTQIAIRRLNTGILSSQTMIIETKNLPPCHKWVKM